MKPHVIAAAGLALLLGLSTAQAQPPAKPAAAVAIVRPKADIDRDAERKPTELMAFAGIKPGITVVDFWPAGGYWTRLFSAKVGPKGDVFAFLPTETLKFASDPMAIAKRTAAEPGLGNVTVESGALGHQPKDHDVIDVVWTFENYHDLYDSFMDGADVFAFNRAIYRLLKPGGVFVIVDHAAKAGSGLANTEDLHRIDPAAVRAALEAAGFKYDGETTILANPADPHTANVFAPAIRGKTDRFAYRFRKPK
ncbi:class I SAM-dependent methyltransferase [soil metagenome]